MSARKIRDRSEGVSAEPFLSLMTVSRRVFSSSKESGFAIIPWIVFAGFLFLGVYYTVDRDRSHFLDLTTDHLTVVTDEDTLIIWELADVQICVPKHKLDRAIAFDAAPGPNPRCDPNVYVEQQKALVDLDWPPNVALTIRPGPDRSLDVFIRYDDAVETLSIGDITVPSETLLNIPAAFFESFGGLGVSGTITAGQLAENGTLLLLQSGRFETREHDWFRSSSRLVDSGTFSLGDVVSIEGKKAGPAPSVYTFLQPVVISNNRSSLRAIITSEAARSRLRLERIRARTTYLEPSWVHRLTNDPIAIGFATVLGLFGSLLAVLNVLFKPRS